MILGSPALERRLRKEAKREMHLAAVDPAHAVDVRVKIDKYPLQRIRNVNGHEEAVSLHRAR